ncbi:MAG: DUF1501 domain-containing protein [Planctomycetaceae bacterium]
MPGRLTSPELEAHIATCELAYSLPSSTPEAGDLAGEAEATQALCGIDDPEERSAALACMCLVARR